MPYTARVLPPDEWAAKLPALTHLAALPDPQGALLVVVEDEAGAVIATWCVMNILHLEGLYIDPAHRHSPTVAKKLFQETLGAVMAFKAPAVLTHTTDPMVAEMATKIGFTPIPGAMFQLDLRPYYRD